MELAVQIRDALLRFLVVLLAGAGKELQDLPIEIAGVAEQMRGDAALGHVDDLTAMARQRLEEANLPTDDATVAAVVDAARRP